MKQPMDGRRLTAQRVQEVSVAAGKVFQPRTPISIKELFAGRSAQLTTLSDAVGQHGLHVAIYGERGVGKTSLANVLKSTITAFEVENTAAESSRLVVKANANSGDTFQSLWRKLLIDISWQDDRPSLGIAPMQRGRVPLWEAFGLPDSPSIDDIRRTLANLPGSVFILDEFDRASAASGDFTDLIKSLSDFAVDCTIVLVGVADTVDQLVAGHGSISRAMVQIPMPRMEPGELEEILRNAESSLGVSFSSESRRLIVSVSQGLPHYTHLIGLHAVRKAALARNAAEIERQDVFEALRESVKQAEQSVTERHTKAVHSAHKEALYRHVMLACAVAAATSRDALGYFNPSSLMQPLQSILGRPVEIATFNNHLAEFCQPKRRTVLERIGQPRGYRYRFQDPLLVPFVFMDALATNLVSDKQISQLLGGRF